MSAFPLDGQVAVVAGTGKGVGRGGELSGRGGADVVMGAHTPEDCPDARLDPNLKAVWTGAVGAATGGIVSVSFRP